MTAPRRASSVISGQAFVSPSSPPRKLTGKLTRPAVVAALRQWFVEDKLTYDQARSRLVEKFQISISRAALCEFWRQHNGDGQRKERAPTKLIDPGARRALRQWLFVERVPYATARERLAQQFNLKIAVSTLCAFWQREHGLEAPEDYAI